MAKGAGTTRTSTSSAPKGISGGGSKVLSNPINVYDYEFTNYNEGNGETTMTLAKRYATSLENAYHRTTGSSALTSGRSAEAFWADSEPTKAVRELFNSDVEKRRGAGFTQLSRALHGRRKYIYEFLKKNDSQYKE